MAWEPFEAWPGEGEGGAFRGRSEPVLASRDGLSFAERVQLFWRSSPDLPDRRVAARVAVTPDYVYVRRLDGSRERVPRALLRGARMAGRVAVYGVVDAEDLFMTVRRSCAAQAMLVEQLGKAEPVHLSKGVVGGTLLSVLVLCAGTGVLMEYPYRDALDRWSRDLWTAESALGFYAGVGLCVVGVLMSLWLPSRTRIDETGVERRRGVVPWLSFALPPEAFQGVTVTRPGTGTIVRGEPRPPTRPVFGYDVALLLRRPQRFGTVASVHSLSLELVQRGARERSDDVERRAHALADRVALLLGLPAGKVPAGGE